jgi:hypothetical protein
VATPGNSSHAAPTGRPAAPRAAANSTREPASAAAPARPDSLAAGAGGTAPEVAISVELSETERAELDGRITEDLGHATRAMSAVDQAALGADDRTRLKTAEGWMADAKRVRAEGDLPAAAVLAHKARVLAEELASR